MRPVNVVTILLCHLKRPLRYGGYLCNQIQQNNFEMWAMLSNVLTSKAISRALLTSYLTRYIKNNHSVATTPLQFRNCLHLVCDVFANDTFWHNIIRIRLDHLYRFATYVSFISITAKTTSNSVNCFQPNWHPQCVS